MWHMMPPFKLDEEQLVREYNEGKSTMFLAKQFGCSAAAISRRLKKLGIKARPFSTQGLQVRLGAILSEESKDKIRQKHIGMKYTDAVNAKKGLKGSLNPFFGKQHSEESKNIQREKMVGRKLTPEHRLKVIKGLAKAWLNQPKGELASAWKGGITPINAKIRSSKEMDLWKLAVKERDDYTCVLCGFKSLSNHADHIKRFSEFPELRFAIDNGRTLCQHCHRKTDTYGNRKKKS